MMKFAPPKPVSQPPMENKTHSDVPILREAPMPLAPPVKKTGESVIILQATGLGGIIFSQGIAQHYIKSGYRVYWPVEFALLSALQKAYPDVHWLNEDWYSKDDKVKYDLLHSFVAPLDKSYTFNGGIGSVLKSKYEMYNLDWSVWRDSAMWKRDVTMETALRNEVGAKGDYAIMCGIDVPVDIPKINMRKVDPYNWTHWAAVIANAKEIHFASRLELIAILEMIPIKAQTIDFYGTIYDIEFLLQKHTNYIIH